MLVNKAFFIGIRKGEELKTPRHASAAASRDDRLPHSRQLLKFYIYERYMYILTTGPSYIIYITLIRSTILIILVNAYSLSLF